MASSESSSRKQRSNRVVGDGDEFGKNLDVHNKAIDEALSPSISRPAPQFAAYDPDFWTPKPKAPAKAAAPTKESVKK